jgi:ribose transport system permease protein
MNQSRLRGLATRIPAVTWGLLLILAIYAVYSPRILDPVHLLDLSREAAPLIIVAFAQTLVMIAGGLDLSIGSLITLVDVVAAQYMMGDPNRAIPIVLVCLVLGALTGLVNGLMVSAFGIPPLITTLGTNSILLGIALVISGGAPRGSIPQNMRFWGNGFIGPIPASTVVWILLAIIILAGIGLTIFGRRLFATGANARAAFGAGVQTNRVRVYAYILSGLLSSVAGLILAAYIGTGSLTLGTDYTLNSIAAAVLGGTAFEGGRGSLVGGIIGALFITVLAGMLTVLHMPYSGQLVTQGLVIIVAVLLYEWRGKMRHA